MYKASTEEENGLLIEQKRYAVGSVLFLGGAIAFTLLKGCSNGFGVTYVEKAEAAVVDYDEAREQKEPTDYREKTENPLRALRENTVSLMGDLKGLVAETEALVEDVNDLVNGIEVKKYEEKSTSSEPVEEIKKEGEFDLEKAEAEHLKGFYQPKQIYKEFDLTVYLGETASAKISSPAVEFDIGPMEAFDGEKYHVFIRLDEKYGVTEEDMRKWTEDLEEGRIKAIEILDGEKIEVLTAPLGNEIDGYLVKKYNVLDKEAIKFVPVEEKAEAETIIIGLKTEN